MPTENALADPPDPPPPPTDCAKMPAERKPLVWIVTGASPPITPLQAPLALTQTLPPAPPWAPLPPTAAARNAPAAIA